MLTRWILALLLASCIRQPRELVDTNRTPLSWCIQASVSGKRAQGCMETLELCYRARNLMERYGSMAGITEMGRCRLRSSGKLASVE